MNADAPEIPPASLTLILDGASRRGSDRVQLRRVSEKAWKLTEADLEFHSTPGDEIAAYLSGRLGSRDAAPVELSFGGNTHLVLAERMHDGFSVHLMKPGRGT
jgi:hypothetical protein